MTEIKPDSVNRLAPARPPKGVRESNPLVFVFSEEVTEIPSHLSFDTGTLQFFIEPRNLFSGVSLRDRGCSPGSRSPARWVVHGTTTARRQPDAGCSPGGRR